MKKKKTNKPQGATKHKMPRRIAAISSVIVALILSVIGIFLIYSATRRVYGYEMALRQMIWIFIGLSGAIIINYFSRRQLYRSSALLYFGGIILLITTLFMGVNIRGERSWLDLGLFHIQPAEILKLFSLMLLAVVAKKYSREKLSRLQCIGLSGLILFFPFLIILIKGDTGTALIYFLFFIGWLFILGFWREGLFFVLAAAGGIGGLLGRIVFPAKFGWLVGILTSQVSTGVVIFWIIITGLLIYFAGVVYRISGKMPVSAMVVVALVCLVAGGAIFNYLPDHQRGRLEIYVNPARSPLDSGYHVTQARIAVGAGGLFGQGYLQGTQSQLGFIPELWTDFIFTLAIEELGLTLGFIILLLFGLLVYGTLSTAVFAENWWDFYVCSGVALIWMLHIMINLGFSLELLPVVGLPLPYVSYGGSFMVTNWLALGLVIALSQRRRGLGYLNSRINFR
ncbi:MAG: rod shape-determining protein RodA [bacterium]